LLRDLLHFRDDRVGALFFFFQAGNFVAGFVAQRFALFIGGDQLAAFFVESAKSIQIERDVAAFGHLGKNVEMFAKIAEVMHDCVWSAPSISQKRMIRIAHPRWMMHFAYGNCVIF
jgi:hypothetical protein